tara:strand:- start:1965 stop:2297 length:333 start_codon:yes stop_codon:yes gene_type:complete
MRLSSTIKIRLRPEQLDAWKAVAGARGVSRWLRSIADETTSSGDTRDFTEFRGELSKLRRDLGRLGNNVNQIARQMNSGARTSHDINGAAEDIMALNNRVRMALDSVRGL